MKSLHIICTTGLASLTIPFRSHSCPGDVSARQLTYLREVHAQLFSTDTIHKAAEDTDTRRQDLPQLAALVEFRTGSTASDVLLSVARYLSVHPPYIPCQESKLTMKITIAATLIASASAFTVNQPKVDFGKVSWKDSVENCEKPMMADRAEHATVTRHT